MFGSYRCFDRCLILTNDEEFIEKKLKKTIREFEGSFSYLLRRAKQGGVPFKTLITSLSGKSRLLLLVFVTLGFGLIPGISMFLGITICYLGIRIAIHKNVNVIAMPDAVLNKEIPSFFLVRITRGILDRLRFLERWTKPRNFWIVHPSETTDKIAGIIISLVGIALALCPPVPFASQVAFLAVFSLAIGLLNDDGLYVMLGYVTAIMYCVMTLVFLKYCRLSQMIEGAKHVWVAVKDRF